MKKVFVFAFFVFSSIAVWSQSEAKFGLKGGLNIAKTRNSNKSASSWKLGLHTGLLAHIHLTPQFALQPELVYSSQGNKYTIPNGEHQLNLNYINVPLLLQYMFDNGFRLQTGPQIGFLVDVNDKQNGNETGILTSSDFKSTDVSWSFGLGYLDYSGLGFDARYNLGISNISNFSGDATKLHNRVIQVGLFYLFDHKHKAHSK